jgi:hypothetical protein
MKRASMPGALGGSGRNCRDVDQLGWHARRVEAVRRESDGELCGHVAQSDDGRWLALTVFGAALGAHDDRQAAIDQVSSEGLASLAERWTLRGGDGEQQIVCIQEANADSVTVALDYYSLPGVPTLTITRDEIDSGDWEFRR